GPEHLYRHATIQTRSQNCPSTGLDAKSISPPCEPIAQQMMFSITLAAEALRSSRLLNSDCHFDFRGPTLKPSAEVLQGRRCSQRNTERRDHLTNPRWRSSAMITSATMRPPSMLKWPAQPAGTSV